jgi:hypothetical protein
MRYLPVIKLSDPFCSYCGQPPADTMERRIHVCVRCQLGMILRAPAGAAPQVSDPFVVIDEKLTVQAISNRAEVVLGVDEPDGIHTLLGDLLEPATPGLDPMDLALLLTLAVSGSPPAEILELDAVNETDRRFHARVTSCGQPRAALLVLAPLPAINGKALAWT